MDTAESNDVTDYDFVGILEHLVEKHYRYFKETLPVITTKLHSSVSIDSEEVQNVSQVYDCFLRLKDVIEQHIGEEEYILFPILKKLFGSKTIRKDAPSLISMPLRNIVNEHEKVKSIFFEMEILTSDFQSPPNASTTLKETYVELKNLKKHFLRLEQIETEQLIPKLSSY
jgi:iron-sulfur cluster repair protein YtfE (RIC family)